MTDPDHPGSKPSRLDPASREAAVAREGVRAAYHAAEVFVERLPARAAYAAATGLAELLRDVAEAAAGLRARMAARVAREEGLTVRALALALRVSRSKAYELVARAAREERARGPRGERAGDGTDARPDPEGAGRAS